MSTHESVELRGIERTPEYRVGRRRAWISPRWRKVLRDLWLNKARTLLVVLSISVGVFAIGVIGGSQIVIQRELNTSYAATNPSHATLMTFETFRQDLVDSIAAMPEIEEAEARGTAFVRIQTGPDEWRLTQLVAINDFEDIGVDKLEPESGKWPPDNHEITIERSALGLVEADMGDTVHLKTAEGKERDVQIVGVTHDIMAKLFVLDGAAVGFTTPETLAWLGEEPGFRELRIRVAEHGNDRNHIVAVTNEVQDKLEKAGHPVFFSFVPNPGEHPLNYVIEAITVILGALGILALLLSSFLVINTISSLMARQVRQIGLMKSFGGRAPQIAGMYMVTVIIFGLLTLLVALPLGAWGAYAITKGVADFFNVDIVNFRMPTSVVALEVAVALLVPLFASLFPIRSGTRVTVHEAMNDYGIEGSFGRSRFDRWLMRGAHWPGATRPFLISLRNTFRRKKRLLLTMITLILAGSIFIAVFSVQASLLSTVDAMLAYFQYDVAFQFTRPYRTEIVRREAAQIPGVTVVESWRYYSTRMVHADGSHSSNIILFAPPADTQLIEPTLEEGRWLRPGDTNAVVVNTIMLRDEPDVHVGDTVVLKIEGDETEWAVVGIATGGQMIGQAFVPQAEMSRLLGEYGQADWLMVGTEEHTATFQKEILSALLQRFEERGIGINASTVVSEELEEVQAIFDVIVILLLAMTVLIAAVGGLGLAGTMSINVLERTREIGIMRAIGASNRSVLFIFMTEGIFIGLLSWLIALAIAWPVSKLLSDAVGQQFINAPLEYTFAPGGVLIWLVAITLISAASSFWPAWKASRLTVREILAYE